MRKKDKKNAKSSFWYVQEEKEVRQQLEQEKMKSELLKSHMHNIGW